MITKIILNDTEEALKIKETIDNTEGHYCPCAVEHNEDTVCMCKEFRNMTDGTCHCGLYTKITVS